MKSAHRQFVLLGLICQGLSWDDTVMPGLNALLWLACLTLPRRPIRLGDTADIAAMVLGAVLAWQLAPVFRASAHFAVGHGLSLLQLLRLLRPLAHREQIFSLIVASGQLAVACTVVLDYRFLLILPAALVLLPRALAELEAESFAGGTPWENAPPKPGWGLGLPIFAVMAAVFILMPRGMLGTPLAARLPGGEAAPGALDTVLDPARSGSASSSRLVLQVDAAEVGYLRMLALEQFDGRQWRAGSSAPWHPLPNASPTWVAANFPHRRVRVKEPGMLNRVLPSDGPVMRVAGRFFRGPGRDAHDIVVCESMWNSGNNLYDYWINPQPPVVPIPPERRERLLQCPTPSPALRDWIAQVLAGVSEPVARAQRLEAHLRSTFRYELGAPELSRLNALEEFLLRERRGHCERFASALTLLLRMEGIPARVVVGFVPGARNWLSGWRNVRLRDAHTWVEAHFPERGWVRFDPTPRASLPPPRWEPADLLDAIDVIWYLNIVNFDATAQRSLLQIPTQTLAAGAQQLRTLGPSLLGAAGGLGLGWVAWRFWRSRRRPQPTAAQTVAVQFATHHYGRMLQLLARHGIHRQVTATPQEFLASLSGESPLVRNLVGQITASFCAVRYGGAVLSEAEQREVATAVEALRRALANQSRPAPTVGSVSVGR